MKDDLDNEIQETERKLSQLKLKKANRSQLSTTQKVAIEIHDFLCHANHTDGCSWYYEIDSVEIHDWRNGAHAEALKQAEYAIDAIGADAVIKFIKAVRSTR